MILFSDIIKQYKPLFFKTYKGSILPGRFKALSAMEKCRTLQSKQMLAVCSEEQCFEHVYIPYSCGQRNCPHCQHHEGSQWIENQLKKITCRILPDHLYPSKRTEASRIQESEENLFNDASGSQRGLTEVLPQ